MSNQQIMKKNISIPAQDGYPLTGTYYPCKTKPSRLIVINSATAVPRQFYQHFALAMVSAGYSVLTYDYRGINDSRPKNLRGFKAKMRDWALLDMEGVLNWVRAEYAPEKLFLIGHSVGGQVAGMVNAAKNIDGMITFSAQSGNWRYQGGNQKLAVLFHSYFTLPLLANLVGYMPWSWFGAVDMPKGVATEWAGWCRHKDYLLGDNTLPLERYTSHTSPVLAYSFEDDNWGSKKSVDMMMGAYPNVERRHLDAKERDLKSLGHFGFFRTNAAPLWQEVSDWFDAH